MVKLKKTMKKIGKIFLCFLLVVALVNILAPLFCKNQMENMQKICSRQNLLLRQQGQKESAVLMTTKKHFCGGFE